MEEGSRYGEAPSKAKHSDKIKRLKLHLDRDDDNHGMVGQYISGQTLRGSISFNLVKPTTIVRVRVICEGYLRLGDTKKNLINFNQVLMGTEQGRKSENKMGTGQHVYPFSMELPEDLPTTIFRNHTFKVGYRFRALIIRTKRAGDMSVSCPFIVHNSSQCVYDQVLLEQSAITKSVRKNGLTCTATVARTGFYLGEQLKIESDIENSSSSSKRVKVGLKLQRMIQASGTTNIGPMKISKNLKHDTFVTDKWSKFVKIPGKSVEPFEVDLPLNAIAPTTKHDLLDIEYIAHVSFVVEGIISDSDPVSVRFPIMVAPVRPSHMDVPATRSQLAQVSTTPTATRMNIPIAQSSPAPQQGPCGENNQVVSSIAPSAPPLDRLPSYDDVISGKHVFT